MQENTVSTSHQDSPPSIQALQNSIRTKCEQMIQYCTTERDGESFFQFEKALQTLLSELGCVFFQLFLLCAHERQSYTQWVESGRYYVKSTPIGRSLKTIYGEVRYWRGYVVSKGSSGGGFYPLDIV